MDLNSWLERQGLTNAEFGSRLGCSTEAVRRYRRLLREPDLEMMALIERATGGAVRAVDWVDAWRARAAAAKRPRKKAA